MIKPTVGPSQIQKYNNMMQAARISEQNKDWLHAAELWVECQSIAYANNWKAKMQWCITRAAFCENARTRGW